MDEAKAQVMSPFGTIDVGKMSHRTIKRTARVRIPTPAPVLISKSFGSTF